MKLKINEIVLVERRPFSVHDFRQFEVEGQKYQMTSGTFRNKVVELKKAGKVELAFNAGLAFYTIPGKRFDKSMTSTHTGVNNIINGEIKQNPIYKWLKNRPTEQQALHNIRLMFKATGIWNIFSKIYPALVNPTNKDILIPTLEFFDYLDVKLTIHHTDTVSVALVCSSRPIAVDYGGILDLYEVLIRMEEHLKNVIQKLFKE
jgi:hypothetical protein